MDGKVSELRAELLDGILIPACTGYIGGEYSVGAGPSLDVDDPGTGHTLWAFAEAEESDVDRAVRNAANSFRAWRDTPPAERGRILFKLMLAFRAAIDPLSRLESLDTGKPISQARSDIEVTIRYLEYYAGAVDKFHGETIPQGPDTFAYTKHEPYGVVAHITPWNSPLSQMMRGVAPCIAVGNVVVVKPSELTPLSTLYAANLMVEAGLPPGVCNVVLGRGETTGEHLTRHDLVQHITFTGSLRGGRAVGAIAAQRIVGCNLELGGKSPTIILPDANLERAARAGALAVVRNAGQVCSAATRLLVHRSVEKPFIELLRQSMSGLRVGHGLEDPDLGPLISRGQRERVTGYVDWARDSGASVYEAQHDLPPRGFYVSPTILTNVSNDMKVAREEIFGPVQSVIAFDDENEAIEMANDTEYGLSAGIFTRDNAAALRIADALEAGQVQINRYGGGSVEVPFGGYKTSGIGRERGMEALRYYTQVKGVIVGLD
jgi:aldehyde dehydrogenase (NAD+)